MTPQIFTELSKKHGVSFLLACALWWMNSRLDRVEAKLYDCLEDSAHMKAQPLQEKKVTHSPVYAVLPKELKIVKHGKLERSLES
jgi:hypothetical protein